MKQIILLVVIIVSLWSCGNKKQEKPKTALDAGRVFIRASLDGDFKTAESLLLEDSVNTQLFERFKDYYKKMQESDKNKYRNSDYIINKYLDVADNTTIINYSNSYMNKPMELKVVKDSSNNWHIDFKYTASGNLPIN